jgi:glycerol-3-phosphate dehydrogenase
MDTPDASPMLTVSSGVHLVLEERFSPPDTGLLIPKTEDGRVLFVMPWEGKTLVGTTDEPAELSEHPVPMEEEIDYLIHHVCRYFDLQFNREDIKAAWSGLRPLVSDPGTNDTAKLSRDHVIEESPSGLLTIAGGKWTTYRKMACDAVDYAVKRFSLPQARGCITASTPLVGAADYVPHDRVAPAVWRGVDPAIARHLDRAYGDQAGSVAALAEGFSGDVLAEGYPFLEAEILWAVRREMACRAIDVLARRTPLALLDTDAARSAARRTVQIMAGELGWDPTRCQEEESLVAERLSSGI